MSRRYHDNTAAQLDCHELVAIGKVSDCGREPYMQIADISKSGQPIRLGNMVPSIEAFLERAEDCTGQTFAVVCCDRFRSGPEARELALMMEDAPANVVLPCDFAEIYGSES